MNDITFSVSSPFSTASARKIAQLRKSRPWAQDIKSAAVCCNEPAKTPPQEDDAIAAAFALMDFTLTTKAHPYELTEEECVRRNCLKNLTVILDKLLAKCRASGHTLNSRFEEDRDLIATILEALVEEERNNGHVSGVGATDVANKIIGSRVVFFGPGALSPGSIRFTF